MGQQHSKRLRSRALGITAGVALITSSLTAIPAFAQPDVEATQADEFSPISLALGGDGVFPNYRIPAIIQLNNGDLLVSYDGRPTGADSPGPNSILQRRSTDGGKTWGETTTIHAGKIGENQLGYSDPSYVYDEETGTLFNFHVFSKDAGFWDSVVGNDDDDRKIISAEVSVSYDNGHTWEHRSITEVVKPDNVKGMFASSGHGIQIKRGPYAGRLVQQFAGNFTEGGVRAYSVYSDDHGETWQMGTPVGSAMDENKVVELSDGTLMMNSRANHSYNGRWVSYSTDGGETWSTPEMDYSLLDPRNNASIIQMNPDAEEGSPESKELLFSNAKATNRTNGTVSYSCDNGETWPVSKTYKPGEHAYSDLVALDDGTFGVVYEAEYTEIMYGSFTREWLNPFCADFGDASSEAKAGKTTDFVFTLTNNDTSVLPAGTVTGTLPNGWDIEDGVTPELAPGESAEVSLAMTAPQWVSEGQKVQGTLVLEAGTYTLTAGSTVTVIEGNDPVLGVSIVGYHGDQSRDVDANPYTEGEQMPYYFQVDSQSNITQATIPLSGDFRPFIPDHGAGNCRYQSLSPGAGYLCNTAKHTVKADELADGFFLPESTWRVEDRASKGLEALTLEIVGDEVDLRTRAPEIAVTITPTGVEEVDGDGYDSVGDIVTYDVIVTNSGNVRLTDITGDAETAELAVEDSFTASGTYVLTEEDIAAEAAELAGASVEAANGQLSVSATADAVTVDLNVWHEVPPAPVPSGNAFLLSNNWTSVDHAIGVAFGEIGDEAIVGDWDGDGIDTIGIRSGNTFYLYNSHDNTDDAAHVFNYGRSGDTVYVGDWDGNGTDTLGVRRGNTFFLHNTLEGGNAEIEFNYGRVGDDVVVGNWDGEGTDSFGVRRGNAYFLTNELKGGNAEIEFNYGRANDEVFTGDFNGDGKDTISIHRGNVLYLNNKLVGGPAETTVGYGRASDILVVGDWDGDGIDTPGVNRAIR